MEELYVRVLLDTGPTAEESAQIRQLFRDLGMTATVEGHSYGGPPPTSAFLVVVNAALMPLLDAFTEDRAGFVDWTERMLALRADVGKWGRGHSLKLEDAHSGLGALIPPEVPGRARELLLDLELSGFDHASPTVSIEWDARLDRWLAHPHAVRPVARRLALRRKPGGNPYGVRVLTEAESDELWRLTEDAGRHAITWQRAKIAFLSAAGWSPDTVARQLLVSEGRVAAIIDAFNLDGLASLEPDYAGQPPALGPEEAAEAKAIADRDPADFGLPLTVWDAVSLSDFLVGRGVVEDLAPSQTAALLAANITCYPVT